MNNMNTIPKVSIIIPVYNGSNFLERAIKSALNQTYRNIEIIVINDGSNDNDKTENIALKYKQKIRYLKKENGGVSSALNLGLREMRGVYFSWLSHDDEYEPQKIENQINLLMNFPNEKILALCGTYFIDEKGEKINKHWKMPPTGKYSSELALEWMLKTSFSGIALLIPKQAFLDSGFFNESLRFTQDADMWRRIFLHNYDLLVDNKLLAKSRLHQGQQTHNHREYISVEMQQTVPVFCEHLYQKGYYNTLKSFWLFLLKNKRNNFACMVKNKLIEKDILDLNTRIKGFIYFAYGMIRPLIRRMYYKIFLSINIKKRDN